MGTWSMDIKGNDAFFDVYQEYFDLYNKGGDPKDISKKVIDNNREILEITEEKHNLWFALALAQWETKTLDKDVLLKVEDIINSGDDLKILKDLGADEYDLQKRKEILDKFLEKLKSKKLKAKPRKKIKIKTPIFATGECLTFKLNDGNYGGALILASDTNPETGYNLIATLRINKTTKPTLEDFKNAEVLICNFGNWKDTPEISWHMPDLYSKDYSNIYTSIGNIPIRKKYDPNNYDGKGYLFHPSWTSGWRMDETVNKQFNHELSGKRPSKRMNVKQLTQKEKWWKLTP